MGLVTEYGLWIGLFIGLLIGTAGTGWLMLDRVERAKRLGIRIGRRQSSMAARFGRQADAMERAPLPKDVHPVIHAASVRALRERARELGAAGWRGASSTPERRYPPPAPPPGPKEPPRPPLHRPVS